MMGRKRKMGKMTAIYSYYSIFFILCINHLKLSSVAFSFSSGSNKNRYNHHPAFITSPSTTAVIGPASVPASTTRTTTLSSFALLAKDEDVEEEELYEEDEGEDDDDEEEEDYEYEYEYEYEEVEEEEEEEEDDEEEEEDEYIELQDDPDDPNYQAQKELIEKTVELRKAMKELNDFDAASYVVNEMTKEEREEMDASELMQSVEKEAEKLILTEKDVQKIDFDNLDEVLEKEESILDAYTGPDAFPDNDDPIYPRDLTKEDMMELDSSYQTIQRLKKEMEEGTIIENKLLLMDEEAMWNSLSNGTQHEIMTCLDHMEHGGSDEPLKWLMFDLNYNITNLILSSVKYHPEAPILLSHWYPQLTAYERYGYVREMDYDFTIDDVENSDLDELHNYWSNLGYDAPPKKHPSETGIVTWDRDGLDDDERELAALENWYDEVYEEDFENHYFDDDDFTPEQNVYDKNYNGEISKEGHKFMTERADLEKQFGKMYPEAQEDEIADHTDKYGRIVNYTVTSDVELEEQFRGHLVVAIGPLMQDVETASAITARMQEEFGKKVFVETRVLNHVREDDNVFEVWLESYEIDLLHSKRKATYNSQEWEGPKDVDGQQLEYLVDRVGYLISDDFRYSYRMYDWDFVGQ